MNATQSRRAIESIEIAHEGIYQVPGVGYGAAAGVGDAGGAGPCKYTSTKWQHGATRRRRRVAVAGAMQAIIRLVRRRSTSARRMASACARSAM